jgi:hypothetical protein
MCPSSILHSLRLAKSLFTTDLSLNVKQIIEYYGARWKRRSWLQGDQAGDWKFQKSDTGCSIGDQPFAVLYDGYFSNLELCRSVTLYPEPKASGAGTIRFCLLRCAKADCRGGSESGFLGAFAKSRATAAKFFHPHAVTHGSLRMESLGLQNS